MTNNVGTMPPSNWARTGKALVAISGAFMLPLISAVATMYTSVPTEYTWFPGLAPWLLGIAALLPVLGGACLLAARFQGNPPKPFWLWCCGVVFALILGAVLGWSAAATGARAIRAMSIDSISWTDSRGRYEVTAAIPLADPTSDVVWSYSSRLDGNGTVDPQAACEPVGSGEVKCIGWAGAENHGGTAFVVTVVVMSKQQAADVAALKEIGQGRLSDIEDIPHVEGVAALDSIASVRP